MSDGDGKSESISTTQAARPESVRLCPACGAEARRDAARYCATCGRSFDGEGYLPADALRSSYHQQRRRLPSAAFVSRPAQRKSARPLARAAKKGAPGAFHHPLDLSASSTALAFVAYALVPYLGIPFCLGAMAMGGFGLWRARRSPDARRGERSLLALVVGFVILVVQIFLWWILYKVPEWSRGGF